MLMDNMIFTNKSYINRNRILTKNGWVYLSVPLVKPNGYKTLINELIIEKESQANWRLKHLRSIKHNYEKCPNFSDFFPLLENTILDHYNTFFNLQFALIRVIMSYLKINTKIILGSKHQTSGLKENELILNILKDSSCHEMLLGIGASNKYIDKKYILEEGYKLSRQNFLHPNYFQPYGKNNVQGLSVIDVIFNTSRKEAEEIVKKCGTIISINE